MNLRPLAGPGPDGGPTHRMTSHVATSLHDPDSGPDTNSIDASFRTVGLVLSLKAVLWLVLGTLLSLVASVKLHSPSMLADSAWLTYGRVLPAGWAALVYGFAGQAGVVVGLWVLARSVGQRLQAPLLVCAAGLLWNLGVLTAVVGILAGNSTGREWLEMPAGALAMLLIGAALFGVAGWRTFSARTLAAVYPSAWFIALALLAFVWFASVGLAMLGHSETRGAIQLLVQRWVANGFQRVWLGGLIVGLLVYALPRAAGRPLASRELTVLLFWCLAFLAPWAVTSPGDPLPRWVVSFGVAGQTLAAAGVLAAAVNFFKTAQGSGSRLTSSATGRLIAASAIAYVLAGALQYVTNLRPVASIVRFTWVGPATEWALVAAAVWAILAVLPEFFERATGRSLSAGLVGLNATLTLAGLAIIVASLLLGGVLQGFALSDPGKAYMDTVKGSMHGVRLSSLGFGLLFLAQLPLLAAVGSALYSVVNDAMDTVKGWSVAPSGKGMGARS